MSPCEAEYYALAGGALEAASDKLATTVEGATRALGAQAVAKELGVDIDDLTVELATDSSAAKSFASRRGFGAQQTCRGQVALVAVGCGPREIQAPEDPGCHEPCRCVHQVPIS